MRWMHMLLSVVLLVATGLQARAEVAAPAGSYLDRAEVAAYIDTMSTEHGFSRQALQTLFTEVEYRQDIIDKISRPAEKTWTWARYKAHLVDADRIERGVEFWAQNAQTLARASREYGVAPEYIVAILGIETRYGQITGSYRVLDALVTLGFDYPPRAGFFRKELTQFLLLAREEGKDPRELKGSYAGAMGYGQFIPSSYRHYAVDFDADGVRDIWHNKVDAIGSIANYFARNKWRGNAPVALPAQIAEQADVAFIERVANSSLELKYTLADLHNAGVVPRGDSAQGLAPATPAALFRLDTGQEQAYWLGLHDFYVITRYNRSHLYAFAIYELSQAIKAGHQLAVAGR